MPNSVKVFISYSHDSKDHKNRVLALSDQLRYDGIDCWIDQFESDVPKIGWSQWMQKKIKESHFILIIFTEFYLKQFSASTKPDEDLNQDWKGAILDLEIVHGQIKNKQFIPVLTSETDTNFIPPVFKKSKQFFLESDYENLYSFLTEQTLPKSLINQKSSQKPKNKNPFSTSSVRNIKDEGVIHLLKQSNIIGDKDGISIASKEVVDTASQIYDLLNGVHPAIEIVGSYIRETKITLIEYLLLFKPADKEISSQNTTRQDYPKFLALAINLSLEQIQKKCPMAVELIRLCSFLDSRLIPHEVFLEEEIDLLENDLEEKTDWNLHWDKIIDIACRYSILNQSLDQQSLRMSNIVQQAIRDLLESPRLWAEKALKTLETAFPDPDFTSWPICEELIPCARAMLNWINKFGLQIPQTARLCNDVGYYLNHQGDYAEAEIFFQKAYSIRRNCYGEEHSLVATTLSNLAWNHKVRKQHEKAEKTYQETIQLWKKIYFGDHPDVAISLDNLGNFYREIGQYQKAEEVYKEALEIFEKFLGDEHLDVVHSLNNLALLYKTQERFEDAESLFTDALEIHENILGKEHPEIAVAKTNLADLYLKQNRFKEAEFVLSEALKIREKTFEKQDPIIASSINNFGILYLKMKNYPLAETYLQKALNSFQNILGFDHPNTINAMKNLEKSREKQN